MKNKPLLSIFLIVFIDLLGFGLILPLLPYYAETFGASDTVIGLLVASYAAAQLIGAPILGRLSDLCRRADTRSARRLRHRTRGGESAEAGIARSRREGLRRKRRLAVRSQPIH